MNEPSLAEGMGVALIASLAGSLTFSVLSVTLPATVAFKLMVTGLGFAYLMYLFSRSTERVGQIALSVLLTAAMIAAFFLSPSLVIYLVIQLSLVWIIRSLYFYQSVLSALADLGLTGIGLLVSIWAWDVSYSLTLSLWCFFLIQSLFVFIPIRFQRRQQGALDSPSAGNRFETAHRTAQTAVRHLSETN